MKQWKAEAMHYLHGSFALLEQVQAGFKPELIRVQRHQVSSYYRGQSEILLLEQQQNEKKVYELEKGINATTHNYRLFY